MTTPRMFRVKLGDHEGNLFIEIPFDVRSHFKKARPPVVVTFRDFSYPSTVSVYDGKYYLPIRREIREKTGVNFGDEVDVTLELDASVRDVEAPEDLAGALAKNKAAKAAWDALSFTHKREHAMALEDAKKPETRARRVEKTIEMLLATKAKAPAPKTGSAKRVRKS